MVNNMEAIDVTLATGNAHKVEEINLIAKKAGFNINFILPDGDFNPVEDGTTFLQNAYCKAKEASKNSLSDYILADDSGLCVEALNGGPGIKSARYADTAQARIDKLLKNLSHIKDMKERGAKFTCAMVVCDKTGKKLFETQQYCFGSILFERIGKNGFGYDPVFLLKDSSLSMAELSDDEKAKVSHRSKALSEVLKWFKENL